MEHPNGGDAAEVRSEHQPAQTPPSLAELFLPVRDKRLTRFPRLIKGALSLVWAAAPREFAISGALQVIAGVGIAAQVLIGRRVVEGLLNVGDGTKQFDDVLPALLLMVLVVALVGFANQARMEQQRLLGELVARHATDRVLQTATAVDLLAFDSPSFLNRLQRARTNAAARPTQMATGVLGVLSASLSIIGLASALFVLDPLFVGLVFLGYVPLWLVTRRASRAIYQFDVRQTERDRRRDYLSNILTRKEEAAEIRSFGLAHHFRHTHAELWAQRIHELRAVVRRRLILGLAGGLVASLLTGASIAALILMVESGRMGVAAAAAAAGALVLLGQRLQVLSGSAGSLYESSLFIEDFTTFVEAQPAGDGEPVGERVRQPPTGFDVLKVDGVSFAYPSRPQPVLRGVSLTIHRGQIVALVGENGSGKTTLAKLLAGLYQPAAGSICWDDVDLATCRPMAVQEQVGVIFQDFAKYMLSASDNISVGRHQNHDREAVIAAAQRAGAHGFLSQLPGGYDGWLGPQFFGGSDLSVGQWQRVAMARAFFRDAPFLILDEPTASLDPRSEAELFENIRGLYSGRTVLLISHRFSTVRSADLIYVLDQGSIVERGSHTDLMALGGLYAELFSLQANAFLGPDTSDDS